MLVSKFEKRIKNIDSPLYVVKEREYPNMIGVDYSPIDASCLPAVGIGENGFINTFNSGFEYLSNKRKRKLLLASVDMAMTPLDKRVEHKWHVIVGNDTSGFNEIVCWGKEDSNSTYWLCLADSNSLKNKSKIFTDEEFSDLIKYIKTLPDGEYQAKVAEHGKTEVKSEDGEDYTGAGRQPD